MRTTKLIYAVFVILLILSALIFQSCLLKNEFNNSFDTVIYGKTSSVVIIALEVGELISVRFTATDVGNKGANEGFSQTYPSILLAILR